MCIATVHTYDVGRVPKPCLIGRIGDSVWWAGVGNIIDIFARVFLLLFSMREGREAFSSSYLDVTEWMMFFSPSSDLNDWGRMMIE